MGQESRLPASTMLFCAKAATNAAVDKAIDRDCVDYPELFRFHEAEIRDFADPMSGETLRVEQWKPSSALRLLSQQHLKLPTADVSKPTPELLAEAHARCLDGVLLPSREVMLFNPEEKICLLDEYKQEGMTQQLITDMFTRMSLR